MILQQLHYQPNKLVHSLFFFLFITLSQCAVANNYFAMFSSLKIRKKLPANLKTISKTSVIWEGRVLGSKGREVICLDKQSNRLEAGSDVTIISFILADLMKNNSDQMAQPCGKKYIRYKDRPKRKPVLWVKINYKDKNEQKKTGYTSINNFSIKSIQNKDYNEIFFHDKLDTHGMLWGLKRWKLPAITKASYLDILGRNNYLAKQIIKSGKIILSRDELEYLVETSIGYEFKYNGIPKWVPEHFKRKGVPPLIQPIEIEPGLNVGIVYEDRLEFIKISRMESEAYFSFEQLQGHRHCRVESNCTYNRPISLIFKIKNKVKNHPLIFVLLSERAFQNLQKNKDKIIVKTVKSIGQGYSCLKGDIFNTSVDFNGDYMPEISYNKEEYYLKENCESEDVEHTVIHIAMLSNGFWYRTAFSALGQIGPVGF